MTLFVGEAANQLSFLFQLISDQLITSSGGDIDIMDLWPDTNGHKVCLVIGLVFGFWNAFLNKAGLRLFAAMFFKSSHRFHEKFFDAICFGLLTYMAIGAFYIVGHDIYHDITGTTTERIEEISLEEREGLIYYKNKPYTGKSYGYHENGNVAREGNWKNGKLEGLQFGWHENDEKALESNFKNGKAHGLVINWNKNGLKKSESHWKDGKENGPEVLWHQNGEKKSERMWEDGKVVEGSTKFWNWKGYPVNSFKEATK